MKTTCSWSSFSLWLIVIYRNTADYISTWTLSVVLTLMWCISSGVSDNPGQLISSSQDLFKCLCQALASGQAWKICICPCEDKIQRQKIPATIECAFLYMLKSPLLNCYFLGKFWTLMLNYSFCSFWRQFKRILQ